MWKVLRYALVVAGFASAFALQTASARTLVVTQGAPCATSLVTFSTIQAAVNAALNGDIVAVCSGTYAEQVSITRGITLEAYAGQNVTIAVPAAGVVQNATGLDGFPIAAQILVQPIVRANVNIKNLTVDGTGNNDQSCGLDLMGIYYQNAGGRISGNTVQNEMLPPLYQGCQDGQGIFVENQTSGTPKVTISGNTLTNFDKNGITVHFNGANAIITQNTVNGNGPIDYIAQNGIEVAYGATANIYRNTVSGFDYTPNTYGSAGILLYASQASNATNPSDNYVIAPAVSHNNVSNAQYGIVLDAVDGSATALVHISDNTIAGSQFAGVGLYSDSAVYISTNVYAPMDDDYVGVSNNNIQNTNPYDGIDACSDNNTITSNTVIGSTTESAIHLDGECPLSALSYTSGINNTAHSNHLKTDCVGFLGLDLGANTLGSNFYTNVMFPSQTGTDTFSCTMAVRNGTVRATRARHLQPVRY